MSLAEQIVGTWLLVSSVDIDKDGTVTDTWGQNPLGTYMFDANGRFAQILTRSDLPVVPNRTQTTADQAIAVVLGSIAMFGSYRIDEEAETITVRFEASTFAKFKGTEATRSIVMASPDDLMIRNSARSGGSRGESVWRRAK